MRLELDHRVALVRGAATDFSLQRTLETLFYVNTKDTAAKGARGHAATKQQQLKYVTVC